uniref:universal stress protein n=1 Tax=Sphingomonas bacterium TaxID=1895847 RepID=UPI00260B4973|nr:universal stress protein [Sphingomonas bacterium]
MLVHLDGGQTNEPVLAIAASLAARYSARVIGIAACQPMQIGVGGGDFTGGLAVLERDIVDNELKRAEVEFRACAEIQPFVLEWRSCETLEPVSHIVAKEARCADLIITSLCSGASRNALTHADTGDLVIRAGRPVLVVPAKPAQSSFETVVIAWADTRECRRAVVDAMPILERAERVLIVEVAPELSEARSRTKDVVAWLSRHKITADQLLVPAKGNHVASLALIASEHGADLIVAGAYGHNRLREWAFGGVTRDILLRLDICALLSH